jgi:hypothetical protein
MLSPTAESLDPERILAGPNADSQARPERGDLPGLVPHEAEIVTQLGFCRSPGLPCNNLALGYQTD